MEVHFQDYMLLSLVSLISTFFTFGPFKKSGLQMGYLVLKFRY